MPNLFAQEHLPLKINIFVQEQNLILPVTYSCIRQYIKWVYSPGKKYTQIFC